MKAPASLRNFGKKTGWEIKLEVECVSGVGTGIRSLVTEPASLNYVKTGNQSISKGSH